MKKKLLLLFSLSFLLLGVGACGEDNPTPDDPNNSIVNAISIEADETEIHLTGFEEYQVEYEVTPSNATNKDVTFELSNDRICTVDDNGVLKGKNVSGSCILTIRLKDNPIVSDTIKIVTASIVSVENITCTVDTFNFLYAGQEINFSYSVTPTNANNKEVEISVEDINVAELNERKTALIAKNPGRTDLIIKSLDESSNVEIKIPVIFETSNFETLVEDEELNPTKNFTYQDIGTTNGDHYLDSTSTAEDPTKVLVIPIEFSDITFDEIYGAENGEETIKSELGIAYNGDIELTNYRESVSSYFEKSSYGNLHLDFDIADVYQSGLNASDISKDEYESLFEILELVYNAYEGTKEVSPETDYTIYDRDKDGFIDSVWFIFSAPNYGNVTPWDPLYNKNFWAFVTNYNFGDANLVSPTLNQFGWASYDFMYEKGNNQIDTHTYIHETGHLFGLNDYYNYSMQNSPLGCYDMQDMNVGDHNAWTKAALGWTTPIIYDTSKHDYAKVHLEPNDLSGSSLFITNHYEGSAFDEYIVLELYSPKGLNELDSTYQYSAGLGRLPREYGVKMYHVDSRLIKNNDSKPQSYIDLADTQDGLNGLGPVTIGASNTNNSSRNYTVELFEQIELISSNPNGSAYNRLITPYTANDFFQTGDTFDLDTYSHFTYEESGKLNNGEELNIRIYFENVSSDGADLIIEPLD